MMAKGLIESETVRMIIMVAVLVILIGIIILARGQLVEGVKTFFGSWT